MLLFFLIAGPQHWEKLKSWARLGGRRQGSLLVSPNPDEVIAVVQVFAARAFSWRGILGVHTWIAVADKRL